MQVIDNLTIVIPAALHAAGLPRYLLRGLSGRPLIKRVTDLAATITTDAARVLVVTDDDEIALLAERSGCRTLTDARIASMLGESARTTRTTVDEALTAAHLTTSEPVVLLRPNAPLLTLEDVTQAIERSASERIPVHVVAPPSGAMEVREPAHDAPEMFAAFAYRARNSEPDPVARDAWIAPERWLMIRSQHDWWIAERLLQRRRVVFVVLGYPAVGLGHVYRASLLAHELLDHEILFLCPRGSELAAERLASEAFEVHYQADRDLADCVLRLKPDLVINDILNTEAHYMTRLRDAGIRVVNFEDLGPGAALAELVVNDVYMEPPLGVNHLNGPDYFCIRDEFLQAGISVFRERPKEILITFGGTDAANQTIRIGRLILQHAPEDVRVSFVIGPGYAHTESLERMLAGARPGQAELANGTKRMSEYMSRADLAFSSAGRTVFELAAMRVPSVIVAAHEREETHTFASRDNGFVYLGRADRIRDGEIVEAFESLMSSPQERLQLRERMAHWDFRHGRHRVVSAIAALLLKEGDHQSVGRPAR